MHHVRLVSLGAHQRHGALDVGLAGGSSLAEQTECGERALMLAARNGRFRAMQYLLEEQAASMTGRDDDGNTVWAYI
jgi:ankyrin repeat protein